MGMVPKLLCPNFWAFKATKRSHIGKKDTDRSGASNDVLAKPTRSLSGYGLVLSPQRVPLWQ